MEGQVHLAEDEVSDIRGYIMATAEEMGATLMRTAFSPNIKERADCSTAIFDVHGEVIALAQREGAECLVTTEKDAVRIAEPGDWPLPLYYLRLEVELIHGAESFDAAVERICFPKHAGPRAAGQGF